MLKVWVNQNMVRPNIAMVKLMAASVTKVTTQTTNIAAAAQITFLVYIWDVPL